jgi:hypothetical protein
MEDISNKIFDIKEKLTDSDFKEIMEKLSEFRKTQTNMYKIWVLVPEVSACYEEDAELNVSFHRESKYVKLTIEEYNNVKDGVEENGSYSICSCRLDDWIGNDYVNDEHEKGILIEYNDDQHITYRRCSVNIIKIESV